MKKEINNLEKDILERLSRNYPTIRTHIPFLEVKNREYTGIGMYVNFSYIKDVEKLNIPDTSLSTNETIRINGLEYGLTYELDINNGKINFIELVTCGDTWNGQIDEYFWE